MKNRYIKGRFNSKMLRWTLEDGKIIIEYILGELSTIKNSHFPGKWWAHLSASGRIFIVLFLLPFLSYSHSLILNGSGINYTRGNTRHSIAIHNGMRVVSSLTMGIVEGSKCSFSALFVCWQWQIFCLIIPLPSSSPFFCLSATFALYLRKSYVLQPVRSPSGLHQNHHTHMFSE